MAKSKFDFVSVIIVAACILALIFLIYKTINMYNQNKAKQANATEQSTGENGETDLYDKDGGTYKFDDEDVEVDDEGGKTDANGSDKTNSGNSTTNNSDSGNSSTDGNTTGDSSSNGNSSSSGTTGNDSRGTDASSGSNSSNTNTRPATSYTNSNGRYMVVAGSFRQESYASSHAAKLRRMGYDETSVSIFNRGTYASVLVDRFSDRSDANSLVNELERKGIDALVITKR